MFKSKTVLVVGADASAEVGLPIGSAIKKDIASALNIKFENGYTLKSGDYEIYEAYKIKIKNEGGGDVNLYRSAGVDMGSSLPLAISVDNYLEAHAGNKYVECAESLQLFSRY